MRRLSILAPVFVAAALTAGCGNDRNDQVSLTDTPSKDTLTHRYPTAGMRLELPRNVSVARARAPGVFRGTFRESFVSAFAYRRKEQLPRNRRELTAARRRLERAVKKRDGGFALREARTGRVAGGRSIELVGDQTISKRRLRTRSLHVFEGSAEYVIELAVPTEEFRRVDRAIFPTIRRTLAVTGRVRTAG